MQSSDVNDLRLLAWFHYGLGALTALSAAVGAPLIWIGYQWMYPAEGLAARPVAPGEELYEPEVIGAVMIAAGAGMASLCLVHGAFLAYIGRCLARRRRRMLCLVFSFLNLIDLPLGTILSAFTLLVLNRPAVREAFATSSAKTCEPARSP